MNSRLTSPTLWLGLILLVVGLTACAKYPVVVDAAASADSARSAATPAPTR